MTCLINFYYSLKPELDYVKHLYKVYKLEKIINIINAKHEDTYLEYHPYFESVFDINIPPNKRGVNVLVAENIIEFLNGNSKYGILDLVNEYNKHYNLVINTTDLPDFLVPKLRILLHNYHFNIVDNRLDVSWLIH